MTGTSYESCFITWGGPLSKVLRASLLRYEKSISDDLTILIRKVQPCPTSSGQIRSRVYIFRTVKIPPSKIWVNFLFV